MPMMDSSERRQSSRSPTESGLFLSRKERGAIAAQACETCRNRKQKCSEGRPKCSSCEKLQTPCVYRSPPVTKKDRTLVQILERLKNVESKIDGLAAKGNLAAMYPTAAAILGDVDIGSLPTSSTPATSSTQSHVPGCYRYASSVTQMLEWPAVRQLLEGSEAFSSLGGLDRRRILEVSAKRLPVDRIRTMGVAPNESLSVALSFADVQPVLDSGAITIPWDTIQRLSKAYFDTYNYLHPLLDRDAFSTTIHNVISRGFGDDVSSVLVLLVLALGEASLTISSEIPIVMNKDQPPGLDGPSFDRPPGLPYFNEARRRMGFVLADVGLGSIQMLSLAALWWDSCGRTMECRQLAASASLACQALITSKPDELNGTQAALIQRNFWHCSLVELSLHMEFELPLLTGFDKLSDFVGHPDLGSPINTEHYVSNQAAPLQAQRNSEIVLHRLCASFHSTLMSTFAPGSSLFPGTVPSSPISGDTASSVCKQLAAQLDQWRAMLPEHLQWQDGQQLLQSDQSAFAMFTVNMSSQTASYPFAADLQVALFRTRYYYTKYLIHRPFIFKVLHYPGFITNEDAEAVAKCLTSCLKWPIAMSPPCLSKRLIPLAMFWTQNLFGILVLLHLSRQHPVLARIKAGYCGQHFEFEADETLELYIDWLRDMRRTDSMADRHWLVVKELFSLEG